MEMIKFLVHAYLYFLIFEFLIEKSSERFKWIFVLLFGVAQYVTKYMLHAKNLLPLILCTSLILYGKCTQSKYSNLQHLKYALVAYGIDLAMSVVMGSICGIVGGILEIGGKNWISVWATIGRIVFIILLCKRKKQLEKLREAWVLYITETASIVAIFVEQILSIAYETENNSFVYISVICIYVAVLFTTLWLLDHHKMLKIQNAYALDNQQMSQKLHRSKEVLPLLASYVSSMDETPDEKLRQKLQDVCYDYGKELGESEMDIALFNTTGVGLLDLMLQNKVSECRKKNIEMEVFVNTEIDEDMEDLGISDGELIRMMGDLLRNAIKAVEASNMPNGMILALVARDEAGCVELQVHDSGVPFPEEILEKLGTRGNTTWGTGNGIADLMESLQRVRASFEIIPEPDPDDIFTKEVCIRFDGKGALMPEEEPVSREGFVGTIQPAPF